MVEAESTGSEEAPANAPVAPVLDWAHVLGFQVLGSPSPEAAADPGFYGVELRKELEARVARFSQSVDDSIVLANDGVIRWLGDPVARLIAGDELLKPRAVILADEALSAEGRSAVDARIMLWIAAHVTKVLGPLEALAAPGAVADPVRDLANRIVQALGVLERDRVRQQVKNLDQTARSALRKLGVRFGALYVFVPALLKPAARTLCSQLWGLRRGEPGAERLLEFAANGRTSFAAEAPLAPDTYRVAGFRLCGERVVRIDIVERLTDMIRAAIPDHMRPGAAPASEAAGFVISSQMTSLTGCAGEAFASMLRSLGYESHRVKKSEFEAATRKPEAPTKPIDPPESSTAAGETSASEASELDAPLAEPVSEALPLEDAAEGVEPALPIGGGPEIVTAETAEPEAVSVEAEPVLNPPPGELAAEAGLAAVETAGEAAPVEEEWVEVWRPAPRRRPPAVSRPNAHPRAMDASAPRDDRDARRRRERDPAPRAAPALQSPAREEAPAPAPVEAAAVEAPREARRHEPAGPRRGERDRRTGFKGPRSDEGRTPDAARAEKETSRTPPKREPRPTPVDMDSPFAKLLALKPLLERRDKRP
jgi:ATP-dependent RNA helicase SUPV3L1/SUV3